MGLLGDLTRDVTRRLVRRAASQVLPEPVRETYNDALDVRDYARAARRVTRPGFIEAQRDHIAHEVGRARHAERVARFVHRQAKERSRPKER